METKYQIGDILHLTKGCKLVGSLWFRGTKFIYTGRKDGIGRLIFRVCWDVIRPYDMPISIKELEEEKDCFILYRIEENLLW